VHLLVKRNFDIDSNLFGDTSSTDFTAWNMVFLLAIYIYIYIYIYMYITVIVRGSKENHEESKRE